MIKVIAFDMVGVLVTEKNINLNKEEERLEKMFGNNLNDLDYFQEAKKFIKNSEEIVKITESLIDKIYDIKGINLFKKLKQKYKNIKIIIATNHISAIKKFITKSFDTKYLDDVLISSEIHKIKPNLDFYEYILEKFQLNCNELLFLDDNLENIKSAKNIGINVIKVEKNTNLLKEISNIFADLNN